MKLKKFFAVALTSAMAIGMLGVQNPTQAKADPVAATGTFTENVWVNGKDIKAKGDNPAVTYKTETCDYAAMYSGGKLNVLVTTTAVDNPTAFANLIDEKGKPKKEEAAIKDAPDVKVKLKEGTLTVQAGKKAGAFHVWVYETKKVGGKTVVVNDSLKKVVPVYYTGTASMANKAVFLTNVKNNATVGYVDKSKKNVSKLTVLPGQPVKIYVYNKGDVNAAATATYTVTADSKNTTDAAKKVTAGGVTTTDSDLSTRSVSFTIPFTAGSEKGETSKFTVMNTQSQQKASIAITVVKPTLTGQKEVDITSGQAVVAYKIMVGKEEFKDLADYQLKIVSDNQKATVSGKNVTFAADLTDGTEVTLKVQSEQDKGQTKTDLAILKVKVKKVTASN